MILMISMRLAISVIRKSNIVSVASVGFFERSEKVPTSEWNERLLGSAQQVLASEMSKANVASERFSNTSDISWVGAIPNQNAKQKLTTGYKRVVFLCLKAKRTQLFLSSFLFFKLLSAFFQFYKPILVRNYIASLSSICKPIHISKPFIKKTIIFFW